MKTRKAHWKQLKKVNPLSSGFRVFPGVLLALFVLVLLMMPEMPAAPIVPDTHDAPSETVEPEDPFEAFRLSRMALPETTPQDNSDRLVDGSLTAPVQPQRLFREERADLDNDGQEEIYSLRDGRLTVTLQEGQENLEDQVLWQSPEEWWVEDFILGDITNDGQPNLSLCVWREGSYGPYKPFWVEANDNLVRNHLFVYKLESPEGNTEETSVKAIWQSSHLARPNYQVSLAQIDGDGVNHLVVVQGDYEDPTFGETAYWKWNGWGFSPSRE